MASLRLFVALWPTPATCAAAVAAQAALCWLAGAKRIAAPDLHLTLAFIGALPQEQRGHVSQAAAVPSARIQLTLDRLQVWKGGTLALRLGQVPAALFDLQPRLAASLQACGVPFGAAVCTAPDAAAQGPEHRREGGALGALAVNGAGAGAVRGRALPRHRTLCLRAWG